MRLALPIDGLLREISETVTERSNLLLRASPGSGKTTRVPEALLACSFLRPEEQIWVLEPRRLAAKFAASRVAQERGEVLGHTIGYQFRLESKTSPQTRLLFLTEGILLRRMFSDPVLRRTRVVVLDEFHERHLHGDIAFAMLRRLQATSRPDLKIVLMSATLDADKIAQSLGDCAVIDVEAPRFPINVSYAPLGKEERLEVGVRRAVRELLSAHSGHQLIFLPGMAEIRRCESSLAEYSRSAGFTVHALHGDMELADQERALAPSTKTKVILSTNLAESSLTIEGVTAVVDSGLARQAVYSPWAGVPTLRTRAVSRASSIQRAGRAGRQGPGRCIRLFSEADFQGRPAFDLPEIVRVDLVQTLLELAALGVADLNSLPWLDPPPETAVQAGYELLERLGAYCTKSRKITELGEKMATVPMHPRLSRVLAEARRLGGQSRGLISAVAKLLVYLQEGESLDGDMETLLASDLRSDLRRSFDWLVRTASIEGASAGASGVDVVALTRCVLTGFSDRLARVRSANSGELVLAAGGSAQYRGGSHGHGQQAANLVVVLNVQERVALGQKSGVRFAEGVLPVAEDWLFDLKPSPLVERDALVWDKEKSRVQSLNQLCIGNLVVLEQEGPATDPRARAEFLLGHVLGGQSGAAHLRDLHSVAEWFSPLIAKAEFDAVLAKAELFLEGTGGKVPLAVPDVLAAVFEIASGAVSRNDLEAISWKTRVLARLSGSEDRQLERLLPDYLELPSGRKAKIEYRLGAKPWVESRLQDFFGMKRSPLVLEGKLPLTLHLLAPNGRAVQVTTDILGFWKNHYPSIRRDLSRQYPRHAWPEDPYQAIPFVPRRRP